MPPAFIARARARVAENEDRVEAAAHAPCPVILAQPGLRVALTTGRPARG